MYTFFQGGSLGVLSLGDVGKKNQFLPTLHAHSGIVTPDQLLVIYSCIRNIIATYSASQYVVQIFNEFVL